MAFFIKSLMGGIAIAGLAACTPAADTTDTGDPSTSGSGSTPSTSITTIQLTSGASSDGGSTSSADSSDGSGGSTDEGSTTTTGPDDTTTGTTETETETGTDTGDAFYDVSWCILQFPAEVMEPVDTVFTVYVRFFADGLTTQSGGNDPSPQLLVEFGYGADGSDPSMGAAWTYAAGEPNVGWGPGAPGYSPDNDEYQGDLSIGAPGIYDYAARISGDGGMTWVYCDLDDLLTGGYTPDMAGNAEIGQER